MYSLSEGFSGGIVISHLSLIDIHHDIPVIRIVLDGNHSLFAEGQSGFLCLVAFFGLPFQERCQRSCDSAESSDELLIEIGKPQKPL